MTESNARSTGSLGSEDSLVLIESSDVPPVGEALPAEVEMEMGVITTGTENDIALVEPVLAEVLSVESEQEQERTPLIATETEVKVVDDISSSPPSPSPSRSPTSLESGTPEEKNESGDSIGQVTEEHKVGAGIAVGIVAAPFVGPVLAVFAGVAAAYGTTTEGIAGDACRAAGDIALVAKEKAIEVDQKHEIVNKTKQNANQLLDKARDHNERHRFVENLKKMVACTLKNVADALQYAADKMKETRTNSNDENNN
mmetsp:Transcript_269/g.360  ORF Transcript_269/g.360 Transcript_269/m.360 type:complete len:256 (+) Transcript_269:167-934(+)|eukprot:CAMPEP_0203661632 /NCGR_PEP_ID=MMETSP0088-20131115/59714_1 /ASSEMBLY_ACC=CAM_ASM_001087 /TAXON_ID=426623 /ORGANISM="Chaetoceros affinis, Strain CCMP159" /LENGTH=255 /DNA_ID=CAMNT_0050524319 /DNA_START=77 /DNA_END=844 /DNA_ORIENTATION=-